VEQIVRYSVLGLVAPYKVQREIWQVDHVGNESRVASKVLPGRFGSPAAAREHIVAIRSGRADERKAPRLAGLRALGMSEEEIKATRHERRDKRRTERKALLAELEARLAKQEEDRNADG